MLIARLIHAGCATDGRGGEGCRRFGAMAFNGGSAIHLCPRRRAWLNFEMCLDFDVPTAYIRDIFFFYSFKH